MERLVFNTAEHKLEELWNYGFESFTRKDECVRLFKGE